LVGLKNIFLGNTKRSEAYSSSGRGASNFPQRNGERHGQFIKRQLENAFKNSQEQKQAAAIKYKDSTYLEFRGQPGYDLNLKSLEGLNEGVRLLNYREMEDPKSGEIVPMATVFIPSGKEQFFLSRVEDFLNVKKLTPKGLRKNHDLIDSMENISIAMLDSFWTGNSSKIPDDTPAWCEIWIRFDGSRDSQSTENNIQGAISNFKKACQLLNIPFDDKEIVFPERIVKLIKANKDQLIQLINVSEVIAEIRNVPIDVDFFTDLRPQEQRKWAEELLDRTEFQDKDVVVGILDTGISYEHPLIFPAIEDEDSLQVVDNSWSLRDVSGHGTEMAGVVLYRDLADLLASSDKVIVGHQLESVKILPDSGTNAPELYGSITKQAVALLEIAHPSKKRVICMAITDNDFELKDGSPSSWSAALDQIAAGVGDAQETKRLFIVSAGNVYPDEVSGNTYPDSNIVHPVEDPAQAWNALSIGAYSDKDDISNDEFRGFRPVAKINELSPYSSTSVTWSKQWPVKPDLLLRGGNMIVNGETVDSDSELEQLTTSSDFNRGLFSTISGTSAATAEASHMAARLYETYPDMWPETVRALLVHSAEWTPEMKKQFIGDNKKSTGIKQLLHACGYGIPSLNRAIQSKENSVNLIVQDEIQPFNKNKFQEMNLHEIPWPSEVLRDLGSAEAKLHVTLSYFIEPGPGRIGWKNRYRYSSAGLRFDVIKANETKEAFEKRINIRLRDNDDDVESAGQNGWFLGPKNRNGGSIHSDFFITSAAELAEMNYLAVYPVVGWWRERANLGRYSDKLRYSLVVSVETPENQADLYSEILTKIPVALKY